MLFTKLPGGASGCLNNILPGRKFEIIDKALVLSNKDVNVGYHPKEMCWS